MSIKVNLEQIHNQIKAFTYTLVAVSKNHPIEAIREAYNAGQKDFGENKVQEMLNKQPELPQDIHWHMIGHLQRNKVKQIAPFVHLIHSVDSLKLLQEINKEALKNNRIINCLLQIHISEEDTKFGLSWEECEDLLNSDDFIRLDNIKVTGLMAMASNTEDCDVVRKEFNEMKKQFDRLKKHYQRSNVDLKDLSMGMSGDYTIALEEGSTIIRIGTAIFGNRKY